APLTATPVNPVPRLPSFSDALLKAGETKATILYDVPPGTRDPNDPAEVPSIPNTADALSIRLTHVQRKADTGDTGRTPFNRGAWLELVRPLQMAWTGYGGVIPVAVRRFPAKPILEAAAIVQAKLTSPLSKTSVPLLAQWGWTIPFVAEGL